VHQVYLSLGSNIKPAIHLPKAIELLREHGEIPKVSNAWESKAVGSDGPNFLNACVLFLSPLLQNDLRVLVLHPIEATLGRIRTADKFAPRTIDIDIVIFDDQSCNDKFWSQAFVVVPLAEIYPEFQNPLTGERVIVTAARLRQYVWMEMRPNSLSPINRNG
jgi:2-amino-4-hydroxy-6-hydroxymethyldihydropteridine diphosphokinase